MQNQILNICWFPETHIPKLLHPAPGNVWRVAPSASPLTCTRIKKKKKKKKSSPPALPYTSASYVSLCESNPTEYTLISQCPTHHFIAHSPAPPCSLHSTRRCQSVGICLRDLVFCRQLSLVKRRKQFEERRGKNPTVFWAYDAESRTRTVNYIQWIISTIEIDLIYSDG